MIRPILGFCLVLLGLMTINGIYLYWTKNRYSCGLQVAAASISLESLPLQLSPARKGSQWKNSVVGRLLARNVIVLSTDQFPGGRLNWPIVMPARA